jgi:hypothetical protein
VLLELQIKVTLAVMAHPRLMLAAAVVALEVLDRLAELLAMMLAMVAMA